MKNNFSQLFDGLTITDETTKPYQFSVLPEGITCFFKPGTEDNKAFASALLALSDKRSRRNKRGNKIKKPTTKMMQRNRSENIILVAKYCLVGWEGMTYQKEDGTTTGEFSQAAGLDFLKQLPHWAFDDLFHNWLQDPLNFIDDDSGDDDDDDDDDEVTIDNIDQIVADATNPNQTDKKDEEPETLGKPSESPSNGNSDISEKSSA